MKTSLITFFATVAALFSFVPYAKAYDCRWTASTTAASRPQRWK